jgi:hypothetical protein
LQECEAAKFCEVLPIIALKLSSDEKKLIYADLGFNPDYDPKLANTGPYTPLFKY